MELEHTVGHPEDSGLEFEKERLALCEKYYEIESDWREGLEKKAHLFFLVLVASLGAFAFRTDSSARMLNRQRFWTKPL